MSDLHCEAVNDKWVTKTGVCHCSFESYEEDEEGVTVRFAGGEPGPVRAKVLIGADGYFSAVRQQCLDDGPPNFAVGALLVGQHQSDSCSSSAALAHNRI